MRIRVYAVILLVALAILMAGLVHIQLGMHDRYKTMSEENRLKIVPLMAPRGTIMDRSGMPIVKDALSFDAAVIYTRIKGKESLAKLLSKVLGVPEADLLKRIKKSKTQPYSPYVIAQNIGIDKAIHLEELAQDRPELMLEVSAKREYLYGSTASNLLGYLGYINRDEFKKLKSYGYRINDQIGRGGIEKQYDEYLRGRHGGKQIEVDHKGREVMTMGYKEPAPGKNAILTIDIELQEFCDELLEDKRGAIVAMNPETGEILAMASAPGYDPEIFVDRKRNAEIRRVLRDETYPMMNRAISGTYPPGSVFKAVIAVAALEEEVISRWTTFDCQGSIALGRWVFHCWKKSGHGIEDVVNALKHSCNVFFWRTGLQLGVDKIAEYAEIFGVGQKTGIDLPGEKAGLLPTPEWKKKRFKEPWYKGETLNYSVGQGYLLASPLQMCCLMSVFANGGYLVTPYVVSVVGGVPINSPYKMPLGLSKDNIEIVRQGLKKVVNDKRGTGVKARLKKVVVAGKTGTAQTSRGKDHGWFAGFAPFDDAKLTVVVFDEYGGKGGYYAADTAGEVFRKAEELGLLT